MPEHTLAPKRSTARGGRGVDGGERDAVFPLADRPRQGQGQEQKVTWHPPRASEADMELLKTAERCSGHLHPPAGFPKWECDPYELGATRQFFCISEPSFRILHGLSFFWHI